MEDAQVKLINDSFAAVPSAEVFATVFYSRLFALDPSVRGLFRTDMKDQGRKLMALIGIAVANARNPGAIKTAVDQLAVRHVGYGVKMEHFPTVGAALLWAFEQVLGSARFSQPAKEAWGQLYGELVAIMAPHFSASAASTRAGAQTTPVPLSASPASKAATAAAAVARKPLPATRSFFDRLAFWR
jgi:hemoglobin-like flavoprotein